MRFLAVLLGCCLCALAQAQQPHFAVRRLKLPAELSYYDNQFSGLSISAGKLLLMSESRLQDKAEAKLYTVQLADLDQQLRDSTFVLPYQKLPLAGLTSLRARMQAAGQSYEGLEAMLIDQNEVYFSVETATPSTLCYLLKGRLTPTAVALDTTFLLPLAKPLAADGSHIYNAGFEALAATNQHLLAFFEYNYFPGSNYVYDLRRPLLPTGAPQRLAFTKLPFRITDITATAGNRFTAINFFFKGEGGDAVYRTPATDLENAKLIQDKDGYKNYCRLISVELTKQGVSWRPLWDFPEAYRGYNWEGIAAYKNGYFLINDKYTPAKPYQTMLLYLQPTTK